MDSPTSAVVPLSILTDSRLACNAKVGLSIMAAYAAKGVVTISQAEVAGLMGITPQALSQAIQPAIAAGFLERVKRGGVLTWRLPWHQPQLDGHQVGVDHDQVGVDSSRARTQARVSSPSPSTSTPRTTPRRELSLSAEETAKVHARYDRILGAAMVTNQIAMALNYAAGKGIYTDHYRMVMNWLIKPEREAELHALRLAEHTARMATEQARLERAKAPYRPAVSAEPKPLKLTSIDEIDPPRPIEIAIDRWKHDHPDKWFDDPNLDDLKPYLAALGVAS